MYVNSTHCSIQNTFFLFLEEFTKTTIANSGRPKVTTICAILSTNHVQIQITIISFTFSLVFNLNDKNAIAYTLQHVQNTNFQLFFKYNFQL